MFPQLPLIFITHNLLPASGASARAGVLPASRARLLQERGEGARGHRERACAVSPGFPQQTPAQRRNIYALHVHGIDGNIAAAACGDGGDGGGVAGTWKLQPMNIIRCKGGGGFFFSRTREGEGWGAKPGYGLTSLFVRKCLLHDTASVRRTGNVFLSFILQTLPDKYSDAEALEHVLGSVPVHARALVRTWGLNM